MKKNNVGQDVQKQIEALEEERSKVYKKKSASPKEISDAAAKFDDRIKRLRSKLNGDK